MDDTRYLLVFYGCIWERGMRSWKVHGIGIGMGLISFVLRCWGSEQCEGGHIVTLTSEERYHQQSIIKRNTETCKSIKDNFSPSFVVLDDTRYLLVFYGCMWERGMRSWKVHGIGIGMGLISFVLRCWGSEQCEGGHIVTLTSEERYHQQSIIKRNTETCKSIK